MPAKAQRLENAEQGEGAVRDGTVVNAGPGQSMGLASPGIGTQAGGAWGYGLAALCSGKEWGGSRGMRH